MRDLIRETLLCHLASFLDEDRAGVLEVGEVGGHGQVLEGPRRDLGRQQWAGRRASRHR